MHEEVRVGVFEHAMAAPAMALPGGVLWQSAGPMEGMRQLAVEFIGAEFGAPGQVVKGAPYSAESITETTQTLADGNRIQRKTSAQVYRDSEGRTRREASLAGIGLAPEGDLPKLVFINDPVAGYNYVLDMKARTARKSKIVPADQRMADLRAKIAHGDPTIEHRATFERREGAIGGVIGATPDNVTFERRIEVKGEAAAASGGMALQTFAYSHSGAMAQDMKNESLGRRNVEGVQADGVRTVVTIPAGQIGNDRPIEIVGERWVSPELQTLVMSRHSDPRTGENVYRLANISRSEPPRSLFEVPADFKIEEGKDDVIRMRVPAPPK